MVVKTEILPQIKNVKAVTYGFVQSGSATQLAATFYLGVPALTQAAPLFAQVGNQRFPIFIRTPTRSSRAGELITGKSRPVACGSHDDEVITLMFDRKNRKSGNEKNRKQGTSIKELSDYARSLVGDDAHPSANLITESYIAELRNADKQQGRWRRIYYQCRGFVLVASAAITVFTAINLHGSLVFVFRLTTLVLSALVTVVTGLLELFQVNNRWRIYRQLRTTLGELGWQSGIHGAAASSASSLTNLGNGLIRAMRVFEAHYISQVAIADSGGAEEAKTTEEAKTRARPKPDSTEGSHIKDG